MTIQLSTPDFQHLTRIVQNLPDFANVRGAEGGLRDRRLVKRLLRQYGYPPDKQKKATLMVLQQAELLCKDWAA